MNSRDTLFRRRVKQQILICISTLTMFCSITCDYSDAAGKPSQKLYQGGVTQNEMIDNLERCGVKCLVQEGPDSKLLVRDVRMGSNAFYKGLSTGDVIKSFVQSGDHYQLTFNRGGQTYSLALKPLSGASTDSAPLNASANQTLLNGKADVDNAKLQAGKAQLASAAPIVDIGSRDPHIIDANSRNVPIIDVNSKNKPIVDVNGKKIPIVDVDPKNQAEKLIRYDIELIIDITGSMKYVDGTGSQTKFEWCHDQVRSLAQKLAPYKKTLTITTFNTEYNTKENCDVAQVEQIYGSVDPVGFTDLVDPLIARCNASLTRQQQTQRPQLVVIISDGLPNVPKDPKEVNRQLIDFSQRLSKPGQITITFLQIGDTFDGKEFCLDLDENLAHEGAKFDLVNTKTFAELKSAGMINALVDAIKENADLTSPGMRHYNRFLKALPDGKHDIKAESDLQDKKHERLELEKQLLGH